MNTFTIQNLIIETLLEHEVTKIDNQKINIGHTYDECLKIVLEKAEKNPMIPVAKTTKNCISWYASKMRNANNKHFSQKYFDLNIQRPRVSSKK